MIPHVPALLRSSAHWRALPLTAVALVAWLAIACVGNSDAVGEPRSSPVATGRPDTTPETRDDAHSDPPGLTVTVGDASILAGVGSFCWERLCVDAIGYITPHEPLQVVDPNDLRAELAFASIAEVSVTASPASSLESREVCTGDFTRVAPLCDRDDAVLAWTGALGAGSTLPATTDGGAVDVDVSSLEPGNYVVNFFVRFEGDGDASYGVLLELGSPV